ncbi:2Fe-2S iron-sulfur cluster binding domain-containing protein [Amphritea atlantica]|uniref:2Fe-2S iron-sulfur cluster binding domain-containing protein n=1 Tax=Amphritea atlantica TaxID=355243 RepID=A0A1H9GTF1_9GAMM|nr:(2Fe-2S)-binding protein [Amphritea atlantica]SEQ53406.1 2Fe-2S iron-sulfur cluster binding domain-containing protein [Amphritea atlantica]
MAADFSFNRLPCHERAEVEITVEGQKIFALEGETVAAAVMHAGLRPTRTTPVSGSGRAPYCMMGVCFDCLMNIDGKPNTQACMTEVREGMVITVQTGAREVSGGDV